MSEIIKDIEDVKNIIAKYEWLKEQAERLIIDHLYIDEITDVNFEADKLVISYTRYFKGSYERDEDEVPIEWLFLSDDDLSKAKIKMIDEKKRIMEEQRRLSEAIRLQAQEKKDREEYARLKAKFER